MVSILLLDDEPHVLSSLRRALRQAFGDAVRLELFTSPHDALARVGEHAFDLVMSDYRMPAMDGVRFLRFVRDLQPDTPRMIVSASTEVSSVMSAINEVGVFRYVVKPWHTEALIADVRAALALAAEIREQRQLADQARVSQGAMQRGEAERRRLEALEPGITRVDWTADGAVQMPPLNSDAA